jgi:hypothetical protein
MVSPCVSGSFAPTPRPEGTEHPLDTPPRSSGAGQVPPVVGGRLALARAAVHEAKERFSDWTCFSWADGYVFTSPVGRFKPNAWDLCDVHGNALEWCQDWYGDYPTGAATGPKGPDSGSTRCLRGGSWRRGPGCDAVTR